jgi:WD40 repeat protein
VESESDFECTSVLHGHSQDVKSVCFHPDRELLVSCSYDNNLKIWLDDGDDWYCADTLQGKDKTSFSFLFFCKLQPLPLILLPTGHSSTVWEAAFSQTGDQLISCSDDTNLIVWKNLPTPEGFLLPLPLLPFLYSPRASRPALMHNLPS